MQRRRYEDGWAGRPFQGTEGPDKFLHEAGRYDYQRYEEAARSRGEMHVGVGDARDGPRGKPFLKFMLKFTVLAILAGILFFAWAKSMGPRGVAVTYSAWQGLLDAISRAVEQILEMLFS